MKQKKVIVFFSAGLGDAVLLIPLVKQLKKNNFRVSGLFNSPHPCEEIFKNTDLLSEIIIFKNRLTQILFSLKKLFSYDSAYVNFFAGNRINLLTAVICSNKVFFNRNTNSVFFKLFSKKMNYIEPIKNIHDAKQNMILFNPTINVSIEDFYINFKSQKKDIIDYPFISVQISAGNSKVTYKNWPVDYWIIFLQMLLQEYPEKRIVLLGDENEVEIAAKIKNETGSRVNSLVGKTSITEAMSAIGQSELFIGLDGGLMHLAVALKKPTFTIWGPSSVTLYGYKEYNSIHKCVSLNLPCSPCSAWINANHTKATNPILCPDHACMQQFMPQDVFYQYKEYVNFLLVHAS